MNYSCTPLLLVSLAGLAGAQDSIYIDFSSSSNPALGVPSSTYAAAGPGAGMWNDIDSDLIDLQLSYVTLPLMDIAGAVTSTILELDGLGIDLLSFEDDEPNTTGDDEALLDDAIFVGAPWEMRLAGLSPGDYDILVYAMAPDDPTFLTSVNVVGSSDPSQDVGGDFSGGFALGTTHSMHRVTVTMGQVVIIEIDVADTNDTVSGLQLFPAGTGSGGLNSNYCGPAVVNSSGGSARMSAMGSTSVAANDVTLTCSNMPLAAFGYFLTSQIQGNVPTAGTSVGTLCLAGAVGRYIGPGQIQNSGTAGAISLALNLNLTPQPTGIVAVAPGETWNFQAWFRDTDGMGGLTSNFSDGLEVMFQ